MSVPSREDAVVSPDDPGDGTTDELCEPDDGTAEELYAGAAAVRTSGDRARRVLMWEE